MNPPVTPLQAVTPQQDVVNAFFHEDPVFLNPTGEGPLSGLRLGIKDLFDIAGHRTGFGNPTWRATHAPATQHAHAVARLLDQGACVVGKTHTDELAFSLAGSNHHYGAPINAAAPERATGGSSCGSAAAVAAGLCDIALGTDTGGSVRAPASFCGLFGFRPTHEAVSRAGVCALAPSFDTVGWFARSAVHLEAVGDALLPPDCAAITQGAPVLLASAWSMVDEPDRAALADQARALARQWGEPSWVDVPDPTAHDAWFDAFRVLQFADVAQQLGPWLDAHQPALGPGIAQRIAIARSLPPHDIEQAQATRARACRWLDQVLDAHAVLVLPTAPGIAPLRSASVEDTEAYRRTAMRLLCIAGLAGCPQVTVPALRSRSAPLGVSLIARPGTDRQLLSLTIDLAIAAKL